MDLDLSMYDGIALQVEGDGQTYKLNLKTADQENVPEDTFQATFDTVAGLLHEAGHFHHHCCNGQASQICKQALGQWQVIVIELLFRRECSSRHCLCKVLKAVVRMAASTGSYSRLALQSTDSHWQEGACSCKISMLKP